ncbi:MAG: ABC transporter ATP-binding protein [Myxococcales bacterium]|nr:ABC transporter ATP-binding protein [Myxococcales bacterium]
MILRLEKLGKSFGGVRAIQDVSLEVPRGAIIGIIGPNGAGKTTLFNLINGVLRPDSGRVLFADRDITGLPPYRIARRGLARTHQVVRPLMDLTVRQNAMVGACFGRERLRGRAAAAAADEILELVELRARGGQLAGTLNLAEKKRLEMARALAARPHLLLLDETLAGLNPVEVAQMLAIIRRVRAQGLTVLMIEHVMQAVTSVSDTIVVLEAGAIIAAGAPTEVTANPRVIEAYLGDPRALQELLA